MATLPTGFVPDKKEYQGVPTSKLPKNYYSTVGFVPDASKKSLLEKTTNVVTSIFPGKRIGEDLGTGIAKLLANKEEKKFIDTTRPTKAQVLGDVAAGAATIASVGLPVPGGVLARIGLNAGLGAVQTGATSISNAKDAGSVAQDTLVGGVTTGAIQTGLETVSPLFRLFKGVTRNTAGFLSGKGTDTIDGILKNPQVAREGMRGNGLDVLKQNVQEVRQGASQLRKEASQAWQEKTQEIIDSNDGVRIGLGDNADKTLKEISKTIGFELPQNTKSLSAKESIDVLNKLNDVPTISATDTVADRAFKIRAEKFKQFFREKAKSFDGVDEMFEDYTNRKTFLSQLDVELGALGKVNDPAGVKKTAARLSTIFNQNKEITRETLSKLGAGDDVFAREAGRQLSQNIPRGQVNADTIRGLIQSVIPPRIIGEITAATGIASQRLNPVFKSLQSLAPAQRAIFIKLIASLVSQENETPQE